MPNGSAWIISFLGYRCIHYYQRYAWIVNSIFFVFLAGFAGMYIENLPMGSGKAELVNVMTFGATVLGSSISWGPFSADYVTYMKEDTSQIKLFLYTFLGTLSFRVD